MVYTFNQFKSDFPNDDICLEFIFKHKYGHLEDFKKYKPVNNRRSFFNTQTSNQIYPTANTIFHKSRTPLTTWFYAIFIISQAKNGVAAMELQRHIGVTYKTAWRMCHQIRKLMKQDDIILNGIVELDETYIGGKEKNKHAHKRVKNCHGRSLKSKVPVFGMLQRGGMLITNKLKNVTKKTLTAEIKKSIAKDSEIMTDEYNAYNSLKEDGYKHGVVHHAKSEYVNGNIHTNSIEGFWGQFKRSVDGTHHVVGKNRLQAYLDEFTFKYNYRNDKKHLFNILLKRI